VATETPQRLSTASVYDLIRRKIVEHEIPPASKINITQLAEELGVSATPIREALRLLQGDNLLVAISNKGYATTNELDAEGVRDLFELRLLIEPWAASVAAHNRLANPAHDLLAELEGVDARPGAERSAMIEHDSRFHRTILEATGNQAVMGAWNQSHCHVHLFRMIHQDWDWATSVAQHRAIYEAIALGDSERAEEAMRAHLHSAYRGFMTLVGSSSPETLRPPRSAQLVSKAPSGLNKAT
jgi:DNA-binding GntR family transcriptional regulator